MPPTIVPPPAPPADGALPRLAAGPRRGRLHDLGRRHQGGHRPGRDLPGQLHLSPSRPLRRRSPGVVRRPGPRPARRLCRLSRHRPLVLCSASPELFFALEGERLTTRPMKGTAPRGRSVPEDRRQRRDAGDFGQGPGREPDDPRHGAKRPRPARRNGQRPRALHAGGLPHRLADDLRRRNPHRRPPGGDLRRPLPLRLHYRRPQVPDHADHRRPGGAAAAHLHRRHRPRRPGPPGPLQRRHPHRPHRPGDGMRRVRGRRRHHLGFGELAPSTASACRRRASSSSGCPAFPCSNRCAGARRRDTG